MLRKGDVIVNEKSKLLLMIVILLISSQLSLSNLSAYANSDSEGDYIKKSVDGGVAIEEKAFNEKGLTSVKIPSTVTSNKNNAFSNNL
ncbi:hypothetical protein [Lysinibacillus sp. NPDC092081]|uniref:hypothetical protein n=1 Tax=Lysinibacillus sp. NPDC092081 TaxID=3364131 RepID=UPI0038258E20